MMYYDIYEDSLKRWGERVTTKYDWKLFEEMYDRKSPNIKLWLAIYNNKPISGSINFYAKNHVVPWHCASLSEYFKVKPVNLLDWEVIRDARSKHYQYFDFNPSGGLEGVKAYKRRWGTVSLSTYSLLI